MANMAQAVYAIDRIENGTAICECVRTGMRITVDLRLLPPKSKEGDVLLQSADGFILDENITKQRLEHLTNRMNKLFDKHK